MFQIISQDLLGLLYYQQDHTGFQTHTILKLSLLYHYPILFKQACLRLDIPLIFDTTTRLYSTHSVGKTLHREMLEFPESFPSASDLLPHLQNHPQFALFSDEEAYPALLESLIILFHFVVQPQYIIPKVLTQQSDIFETLFITIHPEMMDDYIELTQFQNHRTRRLESWFHMQLQSKWNSTTLN